MQMVNHSLGKKMHQIQTTRTGDVFFLQRIKRFIISFICCLPVSLLGLLLLLLLIYNSFSVFSVHIHDPSDAVVEQEPFSLPNPDLVHEQLVKNTSSMLLAVKETNPPAVLKADLHVIPKLNISSVRTGRRVRKKFLLISPGGRKSRGFGRKVKAFLSKSLCQSLFFMTWISSIGSFGEREMFAIESLFKSHPNSCLILVSNSLDCERGSKILKPFSDKGLRVIAVRPDFDYIFRNTSAEAWFEGLRRGWFRPGVIPLEQNLSNLLRLVLLYKYGGVYLDTDVIVLKSFSNLRNAIGAQTVDSATRKWSRLNNAVLIFDKKHPLLKRFIDEFSQTFNGNKWGHNGPYLVSRVVARINAKNTFNVSVLPPSAFYPVDWNRIGGFYRSPKNRNDAKWVHQKLQHIRRNSFAVHLWNRESRKLRIEEGSIIHQLLSDSCIFCNKSSFHSN
ncbi:PREDICTED: lactosylceramide 4-alpha-galactosyltransferase [Tarenaya hassleriana]|uniref:lactosylceramide 4-alpha-galactosyltransferase n=1 Tax=Tarenaya hassleriana TaxID=28532 RepID=UPI00053C6995|nr:PREDICTED: lactosylceramide 4-alpha-galactosyltransferase [Tarenaya hassleriana]